MVAGQALDVAVTKRYARLSPRWTTNARSRINTATIVEPIR